MKVIIIINIVHSLDLNMRPTSSTFMNSPRGGLPQILTKMQRRLTCGIIYTTNQGGNMATSPELYQGIPTYYVELIKKGQEEIRHINARFNQLCGCLDFARQNKNEARINELNVELARLATEEARIKAKIKSYTTCQCTTCKM